MRRGPKPAKSKAKAPAAPKSGKDNARVRDLENRLTEALSREAQAYEQSNATAEILQIISRSQSEIQPVFDTIADNALRLFDAWTVGVYRFDGEVVDVVSTRGGRPDSAQYIRQRYPMRLTTRTSSVAARAVLDRGVQHVPDLERHHDAAARDVGRARGYRAALAVPMLRDGEPIGSIAVTRAEPGPFSSAKIKLLQTFADQAVIAIENVRLFTELQQKNDALTRAHAQATESLEQQTATSEILRVISSSPTDVRPVFDTIVKSAVKLCNGVFGGLYRFDGELIHSAATHNYRSEALDAIRSVFPARPSQTLLVGRAIIERAVVQVPDLELDPEWQLQELGRAIGARSSIGIPMLREGTSIGAILVSRAQPVSFSDSDVALLKTFADQAVIAIENVRLFKELDVRNRDLTTALNRQTATSEILRVISQSPTAVQPVFDTIVRNAVQLCGATYGSAYRIDEGVISLVAVTNLSGAGLERFRTSFPRPLRDGGVIWDVVESRRVQYLENVDAYPFSEAARALFATNSTRSLLTVPMIRQDQVIGAFSLAHPDPNGFPDGRIDLVRTFADQAVIAIENVRLFTELQTSNRELTTALDTQTATSDILRIIAGSQTNVQPVFDAIVASAVRLLGGYTSSLSRVIDNHVALVALTSSHDEADAALRARYPQPLDSREAHAQTIHARAPLNIADAMDDPRVPEVQQASARARGFRSLVLVPLLYQDAAIGAIGVSRREPGGFTEDEISLLQTFADQAVIAIENARLLSDLQARTQELTRSVGQLTALGEVARAVSSTLDLETVLSTIVSQAIQLSGTDGGSVYEYDDVTEEFSLRASRDLPEAYVAQVRDTRPRKGEGAVGRVAQTREPVQIADISDPAAYESRVRNMLLQAGLRALLAVPLIAEDQLVGALIVMRKRSGTFATEEVALLQTFGTQSALAIQNARLFREIEDKSRQLEIASQHKSEFLANMSHELRTPLNAIIGFSEVLTDRMFGELNEKQEEYLRDIYASGNHLLSLINDILDLSKIEAGRMELESTEFDLPTAIDNALMLVRERAARRSITLHTTIDNRLGHIQADERKVRQVVLNLLSNAIKFTPEGGRIDVGAVSKDGSVEISVSDTGIGIAPEDQVKVFEEFRQVGTAAKKVEGTGLGLALCRKFVQLHGGRIWVKSQEGAGSTFTFTIPVRREE
jgi:two-component system, NtrC family, sensor kinase